MDKLHHEDYSQALDVKWFCFVCHCKHHGKEARVVSFVTKNRRTNQDR